jgi:hypothetical protein
MPPKKPVLGREAAEAMALHAIAIVVGDEDLLPRFLAFTGSGADDLRQRIGDPDFLGAVLDFVLENDATVQLVAEAAGVAPEALALARTKLPGAQTDWTP